MKPTILLALVVASLGVSAPATYAAFTDVPATDRDYAAITTIQSLGIIQGIGGGRFAPDQPVTRAELLKIALERAEIHIDPLPAEVAAANNPYGFHDVTSGHTLAHYIHYASVNGYASGYGNGYFKPNNPVTFDEASKILLKISGYDAYIDAANPDMTAAPYFTSDRSLAVFYNRAAQQDLFEMSFADYAAKTHMPVQRRDIARAAARLLDWENIASIPTGSFFTCRSAEEPWTPLRGAEFLTPTEEHQYFGEELCTACGAPQPRELCLAPSINYGFATFEGGMENQETQLVTFRTNTTNPIVISRTLWKNNNCTVGPRQLLNLTFTCNTSWYDGEADATRKYITKFFYQFVVGKLQSDPQ